MVILPPPRRNWHDGEMVLQGEIVSDHDLKKTIIKLGLGLIGHGKIGIYLGAPKLVDFAFQCKISRNLKQCVYKVTCEWDDGSMKYIMEVTAIEPGHVWDAIKKTYSAQLTYVQLTYVGSIRANFNHHFVLP